MSFKHPFQDLYDRIPEVHCKGECGRDRHDTCCGPICCTITEAVLLEEYCGKSIDWLTPYPGSLTMNPESMPGHICPLLNFDGRCMAYEVRPLICRLWGAIEKLKCQWGCRPDRWFTEKEVMEIFTEIKRRQHGQIKTN